MTIPSRTVVLGFRLTTWLLAVPTLAYATYVALETASFVGRTPRRSPARRAPIALTATGLGVAVLAFGLVGVTVLV